MLADGALLERHLARMDPDDRPATQKGKPATREIPTLGLPVVFLGALWGAVTIVLSAYKLINDKRDEILHMIECQRLISGKASAHGDALARCLECCDPNLRILGPIDLYLANLLPLSLGVCLFLAIVTYGVWKMPSYVNLEDPATRRKVQRISHFTASLPAFALCGFGVGVVFDAYTILHAYFALR
jgi:hypothetical protein